MNGRPLSPTTLVASMAGAATTGALIAIGHRLGGIALPFAAIGALLVHPSPFASMARAGLVGLVVHVAAVVVASALCVRVARAFAGPYLSAGLVATGQFIVSWIFAWWTGNGLASALALGDRLVYAVVLGCALVVGMRFAFSHRAARPEPQA